MQFLIIAYDGTDCEAPARRQLAREAHLRTPGQLKAAGCFLQGGAILNDDGAMIGSALIMDFPDEEALNAWLKSDPYVEGGVWTQIEVRPFRCASV